MIDWLKVPVKFSWKNQGIFPKGGISCIPRCIALYYIIKPLNARDRISLTGTRQSHNSGKSCGKGRVSPSQCSITIIHRRSELINHTVACVAGAKRGGGGGREKGKREGSLPLSPIPLPFFPSSLSPTPYPLPLSTPATQATIRWPHMLLLQQARLMHSKIPRPLKYKVTSTEDKFKGRE